MLMLDPAGTVKVVHVGYTEELKARLENEVRGHLGLPALPPPGPEKADETAAADQGDAGKKTPPKAKPASKATPSKS
jgi:hypothetical protein